MQNVSQVVYFTMSCISLSRLGIQDATGGLQPRTDGTSLLTSWAQSLAKCVYNKNPVIFYFDMYFKTCQTNCYFGLRTGT